MHRIVIDTKVFDSLSNIQAYFIDKSPNYAIELNDELFNKISQITSHPFMYKQLEGSPLYRYAVILDRFLLIYRVEEKLIKFLYLIDGTSNYKTIIK